jgi:hypothetical protein
MTGRLSQADRNSIVLLASMPRLLPSRRAQDACVA